MHIQILSRTHAWTTQMQELAPGPLGTVGNLRFTPQQNGTAPASRTSAFPFDSSIEDLAFNLGRAPRDARTLLVHCIEGRELSRCIGNLLGHLTAPATDALALTRIAKELEQISELFLGNLFDLAEGDQALCAYLKAMTYPDLIALCDGIFNHPQAYEAVLEQIPSARLRVQAVKMLDQVGGAAFEQLAHVVVSEPLGKIREMLIVTPLDGEKLAAQLNTLHTGLPTPDAIGAADRFPAVSMLDIYFQSLSRNEFDAWMLGLHGEKLQAADNALHKLNDSPEKRQALAMRGLLGKSLGREMCARAQPDLKRWESNLARARVAPHEVRRFLISLDLIQLEQNYVRYYGWIPSELDEEMMPLLQQWLEIIEEVGYFNLGIDTCATA